MALPEPCKRQQTFNSRILHTSSSTYSIAAAMLFDEVCSDLGQKLTSIFYLLIVLVFLILLFFLALVFILYLQYQLQYQQYQLLKALRSPREKKRQD